MVYGTRWKSIVSDERIVEIRSVGLKWNFIEHLSIENYSPSEERDRIRTQKQDPMHHMSKYVDDLKRKREGETKPSSSNSSKKSTASISTSSSRIEQLRGER